MNALTISSEWVGHVIDNRFPLLQWLGGADRSGVFLTELDGSGSQRVAIKLIPASYANAQGQLVRWAEGAKLSHSHLQPLLHTGRGQVDTCGVVYCVTEYADEVLADILKERALEPEEVKQMLVPLLDALFYLQSKRYVHGHLKPSNILVVRNKLQLSTDGLEVAGEPGRHFRALGVYDAPEMGTAMMAPSADVWSLGMTLVAALTQTPAQWDRETRREPVVPEGIPQPFARMARECLRMDPAQRCTLADVNKARFEKIRSDEETPEPSGAAVYEREEREGRRRGLMVAVIAAVALLAIFAVVHFWPSSGAKPAPTHAVVPQAAVSAGPTNTTAAGDRENQAAETKHEQAAEAARPEKPSPEVAETESAQKESVPSRSASTTAVAGSGEVAERVMPDAPQSALDTIHGTVRVRIRLDVDASGNVTGGTFEDAGPSQYFARLAMDAARKWRFAPGAAGERVMEFDFRQTGIEAAVE
ncbi:MAG TPA: TonB family protein [Acidobacteriaceae bacterium]|nr:TonB family protein [Acidobacteriaceae bacterium]